MDFTTKGKTFHPGYSVELIVENESTLTEGTHGSFRLFIVKSGSFIIDLGETRLFVEAPALLCLNNRDVVGIPETNGYEASTIYFRPHVINSRFNDMPLTEDSRKCLSFTESQDYLWLSPFMSGDPNDRYVKLGPSSMNRIHKLTVSLTEELAAQPDGFWPCRSRSFFLEILYALSNANKRYEGFKHTLEEESRPIEKILMYLHSQYQEHITLDHLVREFGINRTKLNKLFFEMTGESVINYLISLRIRLACLILRDTLRPVKEVAYQTGFADLTHFGRTFKRRMCESPSEYREKYNWMLE